MRKIGDVVSELTSQMKGNEIKVDYVETAQIGSPWNAAPCSRARNEADKKDFSSCGCGVKHN
jgi:hypothetical protein